MDDNQTICCLCSQQFDANSQPRMMPHCEHSACTRCLQHQMQIRSVLTCCHCQHQETIEEVDLEYFPKNISLTKKIKEKSKVEQKNIVQEQTSNEINSKSEINKIQQPSSELCHLHQKELQLICLDDQMKICAHCALFGTHKDHKLKTVHEAKVLMEAKDSQFANYRNKKSELDAKMNSQEFKDGVIKKINQQKERLITEVRGKFAILEENIRLTQKKVYEDIVKKFKEMFMKITELIKEENEAQKKYALWQRKCIKVFETAKEKLRLQQRIGFYLCGPLDVCGEGQQLLHNLQSKVNDNIANIETMISRIRVVDNPPVANGIFNYLNVFIEDSEEVFIAKEVEESRNKQKDHRGQGLFSPSRNSQIENVITPKKNNIKTPSKDMSFTPNRSQRPSTQKTNNKSVRVQKSPNASRQNLSEEKASVQKMVEQFCNRENCDTLDLSGYGLSDREVRDVLSYLKGRKKIKGLKLVKNKLSNEGLRNILEFIPGVTNLNLSFNLLDEQAVEHLLVFRKQLPLLRIVNLSNNKIQERKGRAFIDDLKKQGLIVTI